MPALQTVSNPPVQPVRTIRRWNELIEIHGSHADALAAVVSAYDELEALKRAVRGCGLTPEYLLVS